MSQICQHRDTCRLCKSRNLTLVFELEPTPPANAFVKKDQLDKPQVTFPLSVYFCNNCFHVQLLDVIDPRELFENYVYVSGTSPLFVNHFQEYSEFIIESYLHQHSPFVIDIGSNDGTLLEFFKTSGCRVLGIDPAREIANTATKKGIETLPVFFNNEIAKMIRTKYGSADVVTANNVFAHIDDLIGFIVSVRDLLTNDGIFVFEVSYLADVIEKTLFDMTYHEHLAYHSVMPLVSFFRENGMELVEVVRVNTHGGSLRGIVQLKGGPHKISQSVEDAIRIEKEMGLDKAITFQRFATKINELKEKFQTLVNNLKSEGKTIAAYGAPAKATTLMYHFGIGQEVVDFIVDDSPLKQGLYSPGKHIPVLAPEAIYQKKPNYLIILAWNFADAIMKKHARYGSEIGHFIIPLPSLTVV
jgi:SAM-dependent methyltransferase